jgi:hypothetical protein
MDGLVPAMQLAPEEDKPVQELPLIIRGIGSVSASAFP